MPSCWPGECVAVLAGGSSLTIEQVEHVRGRCRVVAINRAFKLAPWADWLWGCDPDERRFWGLHPEAVEFTGTKVTVRGCGDVASVAVRWRRLAMLAAAGVKVIRHSSRAYPCTPRHEGASDDPAVVRGNNGLYQVLSVVAHTGASTVLLLGADQRGPHFHAGYPGQVQPNYEASTIPQFRTLVEPLAKAGVAVLNCAPGSALPWWPNVELRSVLP